MDGTIGSFLDRLQGFLSKSFLLAGFLPLAAALILNGLLLQWVFPQARPVLRSLLQPGAGGSVLPIWVLLIVLTFVFGMVLASLNPWLRRVLEGRYLPPAFQDGLRRRLYAEWQQKEAELTQLHKKLFALRKARPRDSEWKTALREARIRGDELPGPGTPLDPGLQECYARLERKRLRWEPIEFDELQALFAPLRDELQARPASEIPELDQIQVGFSALLEHACARAEIEYDRVDSAIRTRFPSQNHFQCTELANLVEVRREHGLNRYGWDSDLFELHLLKLVRADKDLHPLLDDARTQLDFTVSVTALLAITIVLWFPLSVLWAPTVWPFLLVAAVGLPALIVFYRTVIQAYGSFAEILRAALDLYRFDLLKALHVPFPKNLADEKEIWQKLARLDIIEGFELVYQHGDPVAPQRADAEKDALLEGLKRLLQKS